MGGWRVSLGDKGRAGWVMSDGGQQWCISNNLPHMLIIPPPHSQIWAMYGICVYICIYIMHIYAYICIYAFVRWRKPNKNIAVELFDPVLLLCFLSLQIFPLSKFVTMAFLALGASWVLLRLSKSSWITLGHTVSQNKRGLFIKLHISRCTVIWKLGVNILKKLLWYPRRFKIRD